MNVLDLRREPSRVLTDSIKNLEHFTSNSPLVKKYLKVDYDLDINYIFDSEIIKISGIVAFTILAKDARDGNEFEFSDEIKWEDEYTFSAQANTQANIIAGSHFDIDAYAIEQININIPVNLSINHDIISKVGSGWRLMSEQQYFENIDNKVSDPRWEKLNDFSTKEK